MADLAEHEYVEANGLRFKITTAGDPASDRLALCLHGFPELGHSWRHQMSTLADLGYRVWAPDLRGYGGTDRPIGREHYAIETLLDDVGALIDASGCTSTTLIAHDWGAMIAWYFAMRQVRPLDHLVIMNVPHPACGLRERRNPRQIASSWYIGFFQLPRLPERLLTARKAKIVGDMFADAAAQSTSLTGADIDIYRQAALKPGAARAMVEYYRAYIRGGGMKRQHRLGYPMIDTPTLMIWGEDDVALTIDTTYGTSEHVSDLTLRYLPNITHWVQQQAPDQVNQELQAFLS